MNILLHAQLNRRWAMRNRMKPVVINGQRLPFLKKIRMYLNLELETKGMPVSIEILF